MAKHQYNLDWVESRVSHLAREFQWPATPDFSRMSQRRQLPRVRSRSRLWAVAASLLIVFTLTMAIPPVRSAVLEWIQVGAVTLFRWLEDEQPDSKRYPTADSVLLKAADQVTLEQAEAATPFGLVTPSWPQDLGAADEVWLQRGGADANVIMIWRESGGHPRLALYQIGSEDFLWKSIRDFVETEVGGQLAVWTQGPHLLRLPDGGFDSWALIEEHVLVWRTADGPTYRLETHLPMDQAIRIAESLQLASSSQ